MAERWREGKGEMEEKEWTEREREREGEKGLKWMAFVACVVYYRQLKKCEILYMMPKTE